MRAFSVPLRLCRMGSYLLLPLLVIVVGCQGNQGTVSGKITYNGQPLPEGIVTFHTTDGKARPTNIQEDGSYTAPDVPTGPATISVQTSAPSRPAGKAAAAPAGGDQSGAEGMRTRKVASVAIPAKFADPKTSGLTYTVTSGSQTHDIELK